MGDIGDGIYIDKVQLERMPEATAFKSTNATDTTSTDILYAVYRPTSNQINYSTIINEFGKTQGEVLRTAMRYANSLEEISTLFLDKSITIDSVNVLDGVTFEGINRGNSDDRVVLSILSPDSTNSGIIIGDGSISTYSYGIAVKNMDIIALNRTTAVIDVPYSTFNLELSGLTVSGTHVDSTDYAIRIQRQSDEANTSLFPQIKDVDLQRTKTGAEIYANLGTYVNFQVSRCLRGTEIIHGSHDFMGPRWEDIDSFALKTRGTADRIGIAFGYTEDVPTSTSGLTENGCTYCFQKAEEVNITKTKLSPVRAELDSSWAVVYMDSVASFAILDNTLESSGDAAPLETTVNTRSGTWGRTAHVSSRILDGYSDYGLIYDTSLVKIVRSQNMNQTGGTFTFDWVPRANISYPIIKRSTQYQNTFSDTTQFVGSIKLREGQNLIAYSSQLIHDTGWNNQTNAVSFTNNVEANPNDPSRDSLDRVTKVGASNGRFSVQDLGGLLKPSTWYTISF